MTPSRRGSAQGWRARHRKGTGCAWPRPIKTHSRQQEITSNAPPPTAPALPPPTAPTIEHVVQALDPPFTAMQMQRYIRFARRLNPTITTEGRRTMVECYRALRENDCVGRNKVWCVCVFVFADDRHMTPLREKQELTRGDNENMWENVVRHVCIGGGGGVRP